MEIKIKTGFFEIQTFDLSLDTDKIVLQSKERIIEIPYNKLKDFIINKEKGKNAKLEIVTDRENFVGIFVDNKDAEILVENLSTQIGKNVQINFKNN